MNTFQRHLLPCLAAALLTCTQAFAAGSAPKTNPPSATKFPPPVTAPSDHEYPRAHNLYFDLPAFDLRENGLLGFWPSMRQSMAVTKDAYYLLHGAILSIPYPDTFPSWVVMLLDFGLIGAIDEVTRALPPFAPWHHEEWHRAVMSQYHIGSYNDIYDLPFGQDVVAVSHVEDDDLVRLKAEHPADQVRLSSAGIEADFMRQVEFDKDRFFYRTRAGTLFIEWYGTFNALMYMATAAGSESNHRTAQLMEKENGSVEQRDFTGLDPNGWVYDLFRPDEPYENRGVHPTGLGIDRYRSVSDFTDRERRYLRNASGLSWLNLLNPQLFGLYEFGVGTIHGEPASINASLQSMMAPFGVGVGLNLFAKAGHYRLFATLHAFLSESLTLPGLSVELLRFPLPWFNATLSPRLRLWAQPEDQLFAASDATPGASVEARISAEVLPSFEFYIEGSVKSSGWIAGNEFLRPSANLRTGLQAFVF